MIRRVATSALALVILIGSSSGAQADSRLGLSVDRHTWSENIRGGLFDPDLRWVPGDRRTETFYVRNQSGEAADMVVSIRGTDADGLMQTGDLTVTARGKGGSWMPVEEPGSHPLLNVPQMQPGRVESVDVTIALAADAANNSKGRSLDLGFEVRLAQRTDSGDAHAALLPATGGARVALVLLAGVLIGLGTAVLRRPQQETSDD